MAKSTPEAPSIAPDVLAKYEPVIGLEVHVQLLTRTKIFLRLFHRFGDPPNTILPCLPRPARHSACLNKRAVEMAMRAALALNCTVTIFALRSQKLFYPTSPRATKSPNTNCRSHRWLARIEIAGIENVSASPRTSKKTPPKISTSFHPQGTSIQLGPSEIDSEPDMRTPKRLTPILLRFAKSSSTPRRQRRKYGGRLAPLRRHVACARGSKNSAPKSK